MALPLHSHTRSFHPPPRPCEQVWLAAADSDGESGSDDETDADHQRGSASASASGRGGGAGSGDPQQGREKRGGKPRGTAGSRGPSRPFRSWDPEEYSRPPHAPPPADASRRLRPGQLLSEAPIRSGVFDSALRRHVASHGGGGGGPEAVVAAERELVSAALSSLVGSRAALESLLAALGEAAPDGLSPEPSPAAASHAGRLGSSPNGGDGAPPHAAAGDPSGPHFRGRPFPSASAAASSGAGFSGGVRLLTTSAGATAAALRPFVAAALQRAEVEAAVAAAPIGLTSQAFCAAVQRALRAHSAEAASLPAVAAAARARRRGSAAAAANPAVNPLPTLLEASVLTSGLRREIRALWVLASSERVLGSTTSGRVSAGGPLLDALAAADTDAMSRGAPSAALLRGAADLCFLSSQFARVSNRIWDHSES